MSLRPFWKDGPAKVHVVENVSFHSTLIEPIAEFEKPARYPLLIWFCGLGPSGFDGIGVELEWLSRLTSKPFVLVAPIRPSTNWWVLDGGKPPWGRVLGSLSRNEVEKYCHWINTIAGAEGIDCSSVSLFGGSTGAYATSEVIACGTCKLHCVGLAAVHGHGQPDLDGLGEECGQYSAEIKGKWNAYINRISEHRTTPTMLIGLHTEEDPVCRWKYAYEIYRAFDYGRKKQKLSCTMLIKVNHSKKRITHNYGPEAMELFLQFAFSDAERCKSIAESQSSLCPPPPPPPTSLPSGRPASSFQDGASLATSSGQSLLRERSKSCDRSRSPVVPTTAGYVARTPRCPVGQDGPLPVDHIGHMRLSGGRQVLYIAYNGKDSQGLWSTAVNIGNSKCMGSPVYYDSEEDGGVFCESVRSAMGSEFAGQFFKCARVGNFTAVGFGGNMQNRIRASRIAAAVCFQLQEATPVQEFLFYPELQRLIKQVKSLFNFDVR